MNRKINILITLIAAVCLFFAMGCGQAEYENQSPQNVVITGVGGGDGDLSWTIDEFGIIYTYETNIDNWGMLYSYVFGDQTTAGYNIDTLGRVKLKIFPNADSEDFDGEWGSIILKKYRITYRRTDGRATPGYDVPYPFDGACHIYLEAGSDDELEYEPIILVRGTAKDEPPLSFLTRQHYGEDSFLTEIVVEFWGNDLAGNAVYAQGRSLLEFLLIDGYGLGSGFDPDNGNGNGDDDDNEETGMFMSGNPFSPSKSGLGRVK